MSIPKINLPSITRSFCTWAIPKRQRRHVLAFSGLKMDDFGLVASDLVSCVHLSLRDAEGKPPDWSNEFVVRPIRRRAQTVRRG